MKQDQNLGWTSYSVKHALLNTDGECKTACSSNDKCDFYVFIDSAPLLKCWCGEYKKPIEPLNLDQLKSVTEVTLKFKKSKEVLCLLSKFEALNC